jgi:hypothetical protein
MITLGGTPTGRESCDRTKTRIFVSAEHFSDEKPLPVTAPHVTLLVMRNRRGWAAIAAGGKSEEQACCLTGRLRSPVP